MKSFELNHRIDRRGFLQGAAGVMGGLLVKDGVAKALVPETASLSVLFWDGEGFRSARAVRPDPSLEALAITISGFGTGAIETLDLRTHIENESKEPVHFYAWSTPPGGPAKVAFVAPTGPQNGLHWRVGLHSGSADLRLSKGGEGFALREGTYLICAEKPAAAFLKLNGSKLESALNLALPEQYLLVDIRQA